MKLKADFKSRLTPVRRNEPVVRMTSMESRD